MRTKISLLILAVITTLSVQVSGQKADLNGSWKLDASKSVLPQFPVILVRIDVKIQGDSLLTERYYDTGDGQYYPFTENLSLDNKESSIIIYDMPRKTKAVWSDQEGLVLESKTTINGDSGPDDFISKETWKVDPANKTLTINYKNSMSVGEESGSFFYNKAE